MPFMYPFAYAMMGVSMASWLPIALWFDWVYDPLTRGSLPWERRHYHRGL